jgi:DNA modification methylase
MIKLHNDNCLNILPSIEDGSIDCIVTDPPYGMDFQSNRSKNGPRYEKIDNDDMPFLDWIPDAYRILKDGGGLISFCDWKTSHIWKEEFENNGFKIVSQAIWNRMHHGSGDLTGGFAPMHDVIWYATKGRRTFKNSRPKSVLSHKRPSPSQDFGHPTCKPVKLMEELIHGIDDGSDGIILDPFLGSGSTGAAAINLKRQFIGIEMNKEYFDIATSRLIPTDDLEWE